MDYLLAELLPSNYPQLITMNSATFVSFPSKPMSPAKNLLLPFKIECLGGFTVQNTHWKP